MLNRFFSISPIELGTIARIEGDEAHHAGRVSRLRIGERIEVIDRDGKTAEAVVETISPREVLARVALAVVSRESPLSITLAMALIKPDLFELVLRKATELGVAVIQPLLGDRVEIRPDRIRNRRERWERIVREAVKQSGRSRIPFIGEPMAFDEIVQAGGTLLIFDETPSGEVAPEETGELTLLIGPEGGWSERELKLAGEKGIATVALGPRRLRAETAAIAAVAWAQIRFGDF